MRPNEVKVGKKYVITYNNDEKVNKITAKVLSNDDEQKFLQLEAKGNTFQVGYDKVIKIKSCMTLWGKILCILLLTGMLSALSILWYRTPMFHNCGYESFGFIGWAGGSISKVDWICVGWDCYCAHHYPDSF